MVMLYLMVILHIISRLNAGGTSNWLKNFFLTEQPNIRHIIISGNLDKNEMGDHFFEKIKVVRVPHLSRNINLIQDVRSFFEIRKLLIELNPDLVNTHAFKAGLLGRLALATLRKKPKLVHTYHGHLLYGYFGYFGKLIYVWIEKILSKSTNHYIINGAQVRTELIAAKIISQSNSTVIYPGIRIDKSKINRVKINLRTTREIKIGWLGRLVEIKNPQLVNKLAAVFPQVNFLIGGTGNQFQKLKQEAPKNVTFCGWVNPLEFWPRCNVALLTSFNEATPFALVEACFFGLPIIAPNVGSIPDIVTNNNGFLVKNFNDYVSAISILINQPNLMSKLGKTSKILFNKEFKFSNFISKHEFVYSNMK